MNAKLISSTLSALLFASSAAALAAQEYPAELSGHAVLPTRTFIAPPADAPQDLRISGKFSEGKRNDQTGSIAGKSNGRDTGLALPFQGQAVQGHSGIKVMPDGSIWLLTDNGLGNKKNSTDSALFLRQYTVNWPAGSLKPKATVFLRDPLRKAPFRIVHEDTRERYLTGGDFDPESIQITRDRFWIGEEFGPYLLEFDLSGRLLAVHDTVVDGQTLQSPDHPRLSLPAKPDEATAFQVRRSKGFEGMAMSPDGRILYPLLEGALWDGQRKAYEQIAGQQVLRILAFDVNKRAYTGQSWTYALEDNSHAIGDFNMIDAEHGLIIERDNLEGTTAYPCNGNDKTHCFDQPARFKRIYKIRLNPNGTAEKLAYIDLMNIRDPRGLAKKPLVDGRFVFPFFTIENVDVVDSRHIIVGNDNNLPFSSSRHPNQADDNELILLDVSAFLNAR